MVKGIRMKEVNSQLLNLFAKLRLFPGATLNYLKYYTVPSLIDETPDRIILHDIPYFVNDIFISAMICRRGKFLKGKVKCVNFLLKLICEENLYFFIDNSNTEIRERWKDGIHLLESGRSKLAENFIYF